MAKNAVCSESLPSMEVNGRSTGDFRVNVVDSRATQARFAVLKCALIGLSIVVAELLRGLGLSLFRLVENYIYLDNADF